jgi:hypothetical protein
MKHGGKTSDYYDEIIFERPNGTILRGTMWTRNGLVTVRSSDGRQKSTQIGGSPPRAIARLMLVGMEEARLGNPMFADHLDGKPPRETQNSVEGDVTLIVQWPKHDDWNVTLVVPERVARYVVSLPSTHGIKHDGSQKSSA